MRSRGLALLLLALAWAPPCRAQYADVVYGDEYDRFQEFSAGRDEKGLFPSIFNLATHSEIRSTATCGHHGPEEYCKLTEHVYLMRPQCDICDANTYSKNHPIDYAIDGTWKWWQSPSLANGLGYEKVNITIDLRQVYQVAYIIIKAGISPRPGTWVLERSVDGVDYSPWQYYARSDAECMRVFGVPATVGVLRFRTDSEVVCTSYYSKLDPVERGEIHTSLVNNRPSADHPSAELQAFTSARFIRFRLLSLRTMYADLMVINRRDQKLDQSVTRRYFYSISDISVGGQCICSGHAETCRPDEVHGQFRCECRHNTCGENCNECCPLFNQLPFKQGTHKEPNVCEACQCFNHAERCEYDAEVEEKKLSVTPEGKYEGGGRCIDCKHNTDGVNCEKCKSGFYRPANVSHYLPDACRPCDCDPVGSEHSQCVADQTQVVDGLSPGDCICKPGFGGRRCDRCAPGYRNHPICERCPCNQAGSLNFETCEETDCVCKRNVEGEFCDRCKPGTIYLSKDNPDGCQSCFCFGKSTDCIEQKWATGLITSVHDWNVSDVHGQLNLPLKSSPEQLLLLNAEDYPDQHHNLFYFRAPDPFRGNLLNSYGSNLHYFVYYVPHKNGGHPFTLADVILEGNGRRIEFHTRLNFFPRENISVTIPFKESGWYDSAHLQPVHKSEFMQVLAQVDKFSVRAKYHQDQLQSSIYGLSLETAQPALGESDGEVRVPQLVQKHPVELCTCPAHFRGQSCEACDFGYRRVNNQLEGGTCSKCECQDHSETCDPFTGHCLNCQHNTTGIRCEHCKPGFYGNPSLGGLIGACKPCACPTAENSHSASCSLSELVLEGAASTSDAEFVCTACEAGYDGNKCEICADGFFGNPIAPNGTCTQCSCNGNTDPMEIGNCDRETGKCLRCIYHTAGEHCEVCEENHWGSALHHSCQPCNCHSLGAVAAQCNNNTGVCECVEGYTGERCDRCLPGHGDVENYCPACNCSPMGALGEQCDETSGQCHCKQGVMGKQCDRCVPGYFDFTEQGCTYCQCNVFGSIEGQICSNVTGECQCLPNVQGQRCEECVPGFFNITSAQGCQACECSAIGAEEQVCDLVSGQCRCKPGVTGLKCNKCAPNHFGFSEEGCKQCRVCPAPGQVCDSETGECVCPPNTVGDVCEACASNSWNYDPLKGCELCNCNGIGADGTDCDSRTGQCKCKTGYVGHHCDQCEPGFFNFPNCEPCNCNVNGTELSECRDDSCLCSNEGQCTCKKHVTGLKCDKCDGNSFSLERSNPLGCTSCFCFNRTDLCVQSNLVWSQIYTPDRKVVFETPFEMFTRRHNVHILRTQPLNYNSYPTNHTPLYWPLSEQFLGDRTSSYNGYIRFKVVNEDNSRTFKKLHPEPHYFYTFPQVLLIGNHRLELEHVPVEIALDGKYKVKLHESNWRNKITPQVPVTRKQLMVALQNVQGIYIRASYNVMYRSDSISLQEVGLDVAVEGGESDSPAIGVEQCDQCPPGYSGLSCQNPAVGFYRRRKPGFLNEVDEISLVGEVTECACHGHSERCEPESGRCLDCQHDTVGDFCELCKPGFHGDAASAHADACRRCACPSVDNSFSASCHSLPGSADYVCDSCQSGYTGQHCELCMPGFFGNPALPGGSCQPCACHPHGSFHNTCHNVTGQCECVSGVEGRDCSVCSPRHAFMHGVCSSCDHGCYKALMELEDTMESQIASVGDLTDIKPIPRKRLNRISNTVQALNELLDAIKTSESDAENILEGFDTGDSHLSHANVVSSEFKLLNEKNEDGAEKLNQLNQELRKIHENVNKANEKVAQVKHELEQFVGSVDENKPEDVVQVQHLVSQAQTYLDVVKNKAENIDKQFNYAKKNAEDAEALLKEVLSKKLNESNYEKLKNSSDKYQQLLKDSRNAIWDQGRAKAVGAKSLTEDVKGRLAGLDQVVKLVGEHQKRADDTLDKAKENVKQLKDLVQDLQDIYTDVSEKKVPQLKNSKEQLLDLIHDYTEAINEHRSSKLQSGERHARDLELKAMTLKNAFSDTKTFSTPALAASKAYTEIVDALRNASDAAAKASKKAEEAKNLVDGSGPESIVTQAQEALRKADELQRVVFESQVKDDYVVQTTDRLGRVLDALDQVEEQAQHNITRTKRDQELFDDHHERINTVYQNVEGAQNGVDEAERKAAKLVDDVDELSKKVDATSSIDVQKVKENIANVSAVTENVQVMAEKLAEIRERSAAHEGQIKDIKRNLNVLREKINEAREKASKVRIAVKSDEESDCAREYISPLNPAPTNTISLKFRPALDSPDSLIFFTATKGTRTLNREYLAVELKSKKIHIAWDIGAGRRDAAVIKKNIVHIPASDRYTWYHIDITRVGNSISAVVALKRTASGEARNVDEPAEVMVGAPDASGDVFLNTHPGRTNVYVGHPDAALARELDLATHRFRGELGELVVDGANVPLWVFDQSHGRCDGATGIPAATSSGHMFRNGFAQVRMPMSERANTMVSVVFSAYSKTGLLYFRGSPQSRDFLAIQLENGHVVVKALIGGKALVNLKSALNTYADGRQHKVRTIRKDQEVHLHVDEGTGQDKMSSKVDGEDSLVLNINNNDHYVAGVPPDFHKSAFPDVQFDGFFGCVQSVRPTQVNELDLDHPVRSQRKEPGCSFSEDRLTPSDHVVGFPRPGYLLAHGFRLGPESSFSFNFRAKQPDALLLYQSGDLAGRVRRSAEDSFIAFYLVGGRLVAHLNTENGVKVHLSSDQTYADSLPHSVFLARTGGQVLLRIDDQENLAAVLDDDGFIGSESAALHLGGLPSRSVESPTGEGTAEPLLGCLSNFYVDYKKLSIVPEEHHSSLGVCEVEPTLELPAGEAESTNATTPLGHERRHSKLVLTVERPQVNALVRHDTCYQVDESSAQLPSDQTGHRFGVTSSSQARLNFQQPYPQYDAFGMQFQMRTRQRHGLLWVWANYKSFSRYFYLYTYRGFLAVEVKGHRQPKRLLYKHQKLSDDQWHRVDLQKQGRTLTLQVDDHPLEQMLDVPNPKVMRKRMFVGGVISKHRRQFNITIPGYQGCLREFVVDGVKQDLVANSRDVVRCARSPDVDYIHQGGFAMYTPLWQFDKKPRVSLSIDFKTDEVKKALVLALVDQERANHRDNHVAVVIEDGELIFKVNLGKQNVALSKRLELVVCPREWHHLGLSLADHTVTISVNERQTRFPLKMTRQVMDEIRRLNVFVGGTVSPALAQLNVTTIQGCLRNFEVQDMVVPLSKARKVHKVVPHGCPSP